MYLAGDSLRGTLFIQLILNLIATWYFLQSCRLLLGASTALAAGSLLLGYQANFTNTLMSENLGLMWSLIANGLILRTIQGPTPRYIFFTTLSLTLATLIRSGGELFLISSLAYLAYILHQKSGIRGLLSSISMVFLGLFLGSALHIMPITLYGSSKGAINSNFSYTLVNIVENLGGWENAREKYSHELSGKSEAEIADFLYDRAFAGISADPLKLLGNLCSRVLDGLFALLPVSLGEVFAIEHARGIAGIFLALALLGTYRIIRSPSYTAIFPLYSLIALVPTLGIVFEDGGTRVLTVLFPMISLLLCSALFSGYIKPRDSRSISSYDIIPVTALIGLLIGIFFPWVYNYTEVGQPPPDPICSTNSDTSNLRELEVHRNTLLIDDRITCDTKASQALCLSSLHPNYARPLRRAISSYEGLVSTEPHLWNLGIVYDGYSKLSFYVLFPKEDLISATQYGSKKFIVRCNNRFLLQSSYILPLLSPGADKVPDSSL